MDATRELKDSWRCQVDCSRNQTPGPVVDLKLETR